VRRHAWLLLLTTVAVPLGVAGQEPAQGPKHLEQARALLDRIPEKPEGHDADDKIADLRQHFNAMLNAYTTRPEGMPPSPTIAPRDDSARSAEEDAAAAADWKLQFSNVERDLAKIIGGGTYSGAASQPLAAGAGGNTGVQTPAPTPVGTVGTVGTVSAVPSPNSRVVPGSNTPVSPNTGAEPTSPGVVGTGAPAPPGTLAAVPAPGTPAAAGAQPTAGTPAVLEVTRPASQTQPGTPVTQGVTQSQSPTRAEPGAVGAQGAGSTQAVAGLGTLGAYAATKVSEVGIKDLDPDVRRQLEQFRIELELFYTSSLSEAGHVTKTATPER
jgi:hypothetical protein